uniref:Uncharacterized protein n=1 Tax=Arundo donax TaxID=35708 RepID=A0A0A9GMW2_ARUDO
MSSMGAPKEIGAKAGTVESEGAADDAMAGAKRVLCNQNKQLMQTAGSPHGQGSADGSTNTREAISKQSCVAIVTPADEEDKSATYNWRRGAGSRGSSTGWGTRRAASVWAA